MEEIVFATSNNGKVASLRRVLENAGLSVDIEQRALELIEPQANTALEVARSKATQAYQQIGRAVVVDDSEFRILALNGFPGPYQKYMVHTIGPDGIVRLMNGYDDRRAYFISNLVYVDAAGSLHEFSDDPFNVTIVEEYDESVPEYAWGALGKICIMEGSDKVLSLLSPEERVVLDEKRGAVDAYQKFCAWYKERYA